MRGPVTEKFLAFMPEKTAGDGDEVIALFEHEPAGDETRAPLVVIRTALAAISGNVFLRDAEDDGANSGPHTGTGAHGTGLVRGVEDEVGEVAAIAARYVFEGFQLHVFDAGSRGFYAVTGAGDDHFASESKACDDRANGIVAAVTGTFGFCDSEFHELLSRLVGRRNHINGLYLFVASVSQSKRAVPVWAFGGLEAADRMAFCLAGLSCHNG